jgi:hypothetical protein
VVKQVLLEEAEPGGWTVGTFYLPNMARLLLSG